MVFSPIQEAGAKSIYSALKMLEGRTVNAITYRGGRGRVALLVSSNPKLNTWIYKPKRAGTWTPSLPGHDLIKNVVDDSTIGLTPAQGGVEGHIIRAGEGPVTSTVALELLKCCQGQVDNADESLLLSNLGVVAADNPTVLPAREQLLTYTQNHLKSLCEQRGLRTSGRKEDLVTRLLESPPVSPHVFVPERMLNQWFLKPISSSFFKLGHKNESRIRDSLPEFIEKSECGHELIGALLNEVCFVAVILVQEWRRQLMALAFRRKRLLIT